MDDRQYNQNPQQPNESRVVVASPSSPLQQKNPDNPNLGPITQHDGHVIEIKQATQVIASPFDEDNDDTLPPELPVQSPIAQPQSEIPGVQITVSQSQVNQPKVEPVEQPKPIEPIVTNIEPPKPIEQPKVEPVITPVEPPKPIEQPKPVEQPLVEPIKQTAPATPKKSTHVFTNINVLEDNTHNEFNIKIIGIGGAGCNVINHIAANHKDITDSATLYAFNTDLCSLRLMRNVDNLFLLNKEELKGYGSGCNPEVGKKAVQKDAEVIKKELEGTDILFIIAGMGKGAGSGGAPELAQIAKNLGILTVSIVNMPSVACEGNIIYNNAFNSLQTLIVYSDSVSTISNEKIISNNKDISFYNAYELANREIAEIISDIINIIFKPSVMNVDFADLKAFFRENKFFMANRFSLESTGLNQFKIREKLASKVKNSFSDVNISNCDQVIVNIAMAKEAPTTILADINKSFTEITKNDKLSMVSGVNYHDDKKIDISFLISGKNYTDNFSGAFDSDSGLASK
ncbi:MAG: hypothetical protein MJ219_04815 [Mycoplasmoidaceae bacterium]|nr:hypothetical protein [Mycoplasmoidaceae bacterium]